jgi:hypothetical protein
MRKSHVLQMERGNLKHSLFSERAQYIKPEAFDTVWISEEK